MMNKRQVKGVYVEGKKSIERHQWGTDMEEYGGNWLKRPRNKATRSGEGPRVIRGNKGVDMRFWADDTKA